MCIRDSFYNGTVKTKSNAIVAVSIFDNQLNLMIIDEDGETRVIKEVEDLMAFYKLSAQDLTPPRKLDCHHASTNLSIDPNDHLDQGNIASLRGCKLEPIRMQYTLDYSFIQYFGSKSASTQYLYARFNEMKAIYAFRDIPVNISSHRWLYTFSSSLWTFNFNNILGGLFNNYVGRFSTPSNKWDVTAAVTAVNNQGGLSSPLNYGGCLLYTSPSPRALSTSRMPSSA